MKISAYTTSRNADEMDYPYLEAIKSHLAFADEVVVFDTSNGKDKTLERLRVLASVEPKLKVVHSDKIDWSAPNHGVFDGQTKALSRKQCSGDVLWQFDCVPGGTKIMTISGEKSIEDIQPGEQVLTHKGRFRKVIKTYIRPEAEYDLYSIKKRGDTRELLVTGNHPISLWNGEKYEWHKLENGLPTKDKMYCYPKLSVEHKDIEYRVNVTIGRGKTVETILIPDYKLGYLSGLYLGDGHIGYDGCNMQYVIFSLSNYQIYVVNNIRDYMKELFGVDKISHWENEGGKNYIKVQVGNRGVAKFFNKLFNTGSRNKRLPDDIYNWPKEAICGLLEGYFESDGCIARSGLALTSVNSELLSQVKLLLTKIDICATFSKHSSVGFGTDTEYHRLNISGKQINNLPFMFKQLKPGKKQHFSISENAFHHKVYHFGSNITNVKYCGKLYNLEIEEDNTYVANGIVVHNCDEIVHEKHAPMIRPFAEQFMSQNNYDLMALPVVDYWGREGKARLDVTIWKWRLSKNKPDITHGIPAQLRNYAPDGLLYARHGTDGCVIPGTKVMTIVGEKPIEDIKIGELVYTHTGRFKPVTRTYVRSVENCDLFKLNFREFLGKPLNITGNHPIWLADYNSAHVPAWHSLNDGLPDRQKCYIFPKYHDDSKTEPEYSITVADYKNRTTKNITVRPNKDIGFLIGLFLGDGNITRRNNVRAKNQFKSVKFSLSSYQLDVARRIQNIMTNEFGVKTSIYENNKKNYIEVVINNKDVSKFIFDLCSTGSKNKILHQSIYSWNKESILGLLEGLYQSDGAGCRAGMNVTMINGELLSQVKVLLTKLNIFASLKSYRKKPTCFQNKEIDMFQLRITGPQADSLTFLSKTPSTKKRFVETDEYFAVRTKASRIEQYKYTGVVHNLEVKDDNSYIANGIVVHNCDYISVASGNPIPCAGFLPEGFDRMKHSAIKDEKLVPKTERFINEFLKQLPAVHHYSWFNIERKIKNYRTFWNASWKSLYNEDRDEKTNPFFLGLTWAEITDEMITEKAKLLETETCGWIFHSPWDGSKTNGYSVEMGQPEIMKEWIGENK